MGLALVDWRCWGEMGRTLPRRDSVLPSEFQTGSRPWRRGPPPAALRARHAKHAKHAKQWQGSYGAPGLPGPDAISTATELQDQRGRNTEI